MVTRLWHDRDLRRFRHEAEARNLAPLVRALSGPVRLLFAHTCQFSEKYVQNPLPSAAGASAPQSNLVRYDLNVWRASQGGPESSYDRSAWLPADLIPVQHFRQIFLWPLAMRHPSLKPNEALKPEDWKTSAECIKQLANRIPVPWIPVPDPLQHISCGDGTERVLPPDDGRCKPFPNERNYEEFVYFYEFVQRFLYQPGEASHVRLFERRDIRAVEVDIEFGEWDGTANKKYRTARFFFDVERLNLYLFCTGVAVLAVEIATRSSPAVRWGDTSEPSHGRSCTGEPVQLNLRHVLQFQDHFRRSYAPYWEDRGVGRLHPGRVPRRVAWLKQDEKIAVEGHYGPEHLNSELSRLAEPADGIRVAPVLSHWRDLLPLRLLGDNARFRDQLFSWRQVVDDRIPFMTFLDADPTQISRGDWIRLCLADEAGGDPLPYAPESLAVFEEKHCYDAFWQGWDGANEVWKPQTRQLFSGYAYVLSGSGKFFRENILHHFRRQYFQMALLAHFEMAALLTYSNWISEAIARRDEGDPAGFRGRFGQVLLRIKEEFVDFGHRFRFLGVSNQVQAIEMYRCWRKHLDLKELYAEVKEELDSATSYLLAGEQTQQATASTALARIAALVAMLGLPMAFFGMNILFAGGLPHLLTDILTWLNWAWLREPASPMGAWVGACRDVAAFSLTAFTFVALTKRWVVHDLPNPEQDSLEQLTRRVKCGLAVTSFCTGALWIIGRFILPY